MATLLRILIHLIGRSLRWQIEDRANVLNTMPKTPVIFALWHNRLFLVPYLAHQHWSRRRVAVMVSASKDGEKLVRVLEQFHLTCVRGSTSRRGPQALLQMTRYMQDGFDAGITPDGPRGPKYRVAEGVISLAQVTGTPIIPISWDVTWKITLKSWDAFMIPLPFARATLRIGEPIQAGREVDRETKRRELEAKLLEFAAP